MSATQAPDFAAPAFLRAHVAALLGYWADPAKAAPQGGTYHVLLDDGSCPDPATRHLVSSTRLVVNFSWGARRRPAHPSAPAWAAKAADCLHFLRAAHAGRSPAMRSTRQKSVRSRQPLRLSKQATK